MISIIPNLGTHLIFRLAIYCVDKNNLYYKSMEDSEFTLASSVLKLQLRHPKATPPPMITENQNGLTHKNVDFISKLETMFKMHSFKFNVFFHCSS